MVEIAKMLVLSTGHLTADTCVYRCHGLIGAYEKGEYGWFVHVEGTASLDEIPEDLAACLAFAIIEGCEWIMFDRDGPTVPELPTYDW